MFDFPELDMNLVKEYMGTGAVAGGAPGVSAINTGMDMGGSVADAASGAWDFASNAVSNIGSLDPSMIGGPFKPSFGGGGSSGSAGVGAASGSVDTNSYGLLDAPIY